MQHSNDHPTDPKQLTVGLLVDTISGEAHASLWPGIADTLQENGVNLICFVGGHLQDPHNLQHQGNVVFDLLDKNNFDGIIIWASALSSYIGREYIREFCDRYRPLPMVSIGMISPEIPCVILDSYQGMYDIMVHLIEHHGYRRLAFIRGPKNHFDADERYRAYIDALNDYGIPYSSDLVSPHYKWTETGGRDAVRLWFDEKNIDIDAIIAVSDIVAIDALQELQALGIQVPEDVAITGFDNIALSRAIHPPLTTVPWRAYERGQQIANLILAHMAGDPVTKQLNLPTRLIIRQSCGCVDPMRVRAKVTLNPSNHPQEKTLTLQYLNKTWPDLRQQILLEIDQILETQTSTSEQTAQLLDAYFDNIKSPEQEIFITTLESILNEVAQTGRDVTRWHDVISSLRRQISSRLTEDHESLFIAENLCHQARVIVGTTAQRTQAYQRWLETKQNDHLRRISHVLTTTTSTQQLMDLLAQELPLLDIRKCYLALYESPDHPDQNCRLVLSFDDYGRTILPSSEELFSSRQLASGKFFPPSERYNMVVCPLYVQDESLGFVLFERKLPGEIFDILQDEISNTLKAVKLMEENALLYQQSLVAEQEAQIGRQRAEEANQLKSRFLSMVSHELLTPIVLLSGLSELMLHQANDEMPPIQTYQRDLTRIHISAQQLGSLVRDVLDLARSQVGQLRLTVRPLDLRETLQSVVLVGEQLAKEKGLSWQADIPDQLPLVMGDPVRLQQVTLNLITNAVKFTSHGYVKLNVRTNNQSLTVEVRDTGIGVPKEEQKTIFDEFRQSERTATRGYGGLGIGLAVCRQIIKLHGGQIGIDSSGDVNKGSSFYFTLSTLTDHIPEEITYQEPSQEVLLLAKLTERSSGLNEYLSNEGFQIRTLDPDDNPDWLSQIIATPPGALVLDCAPETEQSWHLIESLKENPITQEIPILFCSLTDNQNSGGILDLDYLTKPMRESALARILRHNSLSDKSEDSQIVLIVDDDPSILKMHRKLIEQSLPNCRVMEAENGRIALEQMRKTPPSLVLLDLRMPEVDGLGVLAEMQNHEKLRNIPVIVLTAQTLVEEEMEQLSRGVVSVLSKGVLSTEETFTQIQLALAKNKSLGSEAQRLVRKAIIYIHGNYAQSLSRKMIASHVGVSERHLDRCFFEQMGISPSTYLSRYRIKQAKELLNTEGFSITKTAQTVGFSSSSYFAEVFRREVGVSPRQYQKGNRSDKQ